MKTVSIRALLCSTYTDRKHDDSDREVKVCAKKKRKGKENFVTGGAASYLMLVAVVMV